MNERKFSNKFGGWCIRCKGRVEQFAGQTWKANGKWLVEHNGPCNAPASDAPRAPREPQAPKANQYGGKCALCGVYVAEKAGRIVKTNAGWKAAHLDAAGCVSAAAAAQEAPTAPRPARRVYDIPTGYYAVPSATGNNDLDFYRVNSPTEGKWATYSFVDRMIGGQGRQPISRIEQTVALDAIEAAGPDAAAMLYAKEVGNCFVCNKLLTDDDSRARGMGLKCFNDRQQKVAVAA